MLSEDYLRADYHYRRAQSVGTREHNHFGVYVPAEPSFSDRLAEIAFRPATWISLGLLALCIGLLKAF